MIDQDLIDRASRACWEWFENVTDRWPGTERHPAIGWKDATTGFYHCQPESKVAALRPEPGRGFDHNIDCHECGRPIWLYWYNDDEYRKAKECFDCHFWLQHIRSKESIIIEREDGPHHYMLGGRTKPSEWNGFGGLWFEINFNDGKTVEICDLWHQGLIPERFRDRLKPNAKLQEIGRKRPEKKS